MMTGKEIEKAIIKQLPINYISPENPEIVYTGRITKACFGKLWFMGKNGDRKLIVGCLDPLSEKEIREAKKSINTKCLAINPLGKEHFSLP